MLRVNAPISLRQLCDEGQNSELTLRKVSRVLRVHFRRQRTAVIGPDLSHRRTLFNEIINSAPVQASIDREVSERGVTREILARQLRQAFFGDEAQRIQRGRDDVRVMVRYPKDERTSLDNLEKMLIRAPDGSEIPFSSAAEYRFGRSPTSIRRFNRARVRLAAVRALGAAELDAESGALLLSAWTSGNGGKDTDVQDTDADTDVNDPDTLLDPVVVVSPEAPGTADDLLGSVTNPVKSLWAVAAPRIIFPMPGMSTRK